MQSETKTSEMIDVFLSYKRNRSGSSANTIATYRQELNNFSRFIENKPSNQITVKDIDTYAEALSLKNYKPKTFRNKLVPIRCFIRFLYVKDINTLKPEAIDIPKISENTEANFLTEQEAQQLLDVIEDTRDRAMIHILLVSGVRVSELTDFRYQDVHERSIIVRKGKGKKSRLVFITREAEKDLKDYIKVRGRWEGYLFPTATGNHRKKKLVNHPLSRAIVSRKVTQYADKADIQKKVSSHTLRHTCATGLLRKGLRVEDVQQILGHSNIRNTLIYLHFTNDYLKEKYDQAHAVAQ